MLLVREPKNGCITRVQLQFVSGADILESLQAAIRLARSLSHSYSGCRVCFVFEGVHMEVSEFSNATELLSYFFTRRRMLLRSGGYARLNGSGRAP